MTINANQIDDKCYLVVVVDENGNTLHEDCCYIRDVEKMVAELRADFNI